MRQYWLLERMTVAEFERQFLTQWPVFNHSHFERSVDGLLCFLNRLEVGSCFDIGYSLRCILCVSVLQLSPQILAAEIDLRHPGFRELNTAVANWLMVTVGAKSYEPKTGARMSYMFHGGMPGRIQYQVDHRGDIVGEANVKPVDLSREDLVDLVTTGFDAMQQRGQLLLELGIAAGSVPDPEKMTGLERKAYAEEVDKLAIPYSPADLYWAWERAQKLAEEMRKKGPSYPPSDAKPVDKEAYWADVYKQATASGNVRTYLQDKGIPRTTYYDNTSSLRKTRKTPKK